MTGDESASMLEQIKVVWLRRKWLALGLLALPLVISASAAAFLPSLFRSTALLIVQPDPLEAGLGGGTQQGAAEEQLQMLDQENLSRSRLEELITRYGLYRELRGHGSAEAAIDRLRKDVQVEIKDAERSGGHAALAFSVSYGGRDPATVAEVANSLAAFYVEQSAARRQQLRAGAVRLLRAQLDEVEGRLSGEEKRVSGFKAQHLRELPEQVRVNLATVERLNARLELNREKQKRLLAEQRSPTAQGQPQLDGNAIQLARLREELKDLRSRETEQHPDLRHLKAQIAALSAQISPARASAPGAPGEALPPEHWDTEAAGPKTELHALENEEKALNQAIGEYEEKVYNAPKREQELQTLLPTYQATKALHDALLSRFEAATLAEARAQRSDDGPFRIIDRAVVSKQPVAPNRVRLLVLGFALAITLALGGTLLAEQLDTSLHSLDELRALTQVPVLVSVPAIFTSCDATEHKRRLLLFAAVAVVALCSTVLGTYAVTHGNESLVWMLAPRGHT